MGKAMTVAILYLNVPLSVFRRTLKRIVQRPHILTGSIIIAVTLALFVVNMSSWMKKHTESAREQDIGWHKEVRLIRRSVRQLDLPQRHLVSDSSSPAKIFTDLLSQHRVIDYCHLPENPVVGMEGFIVDGYTLEQVHIVVSSGAEYPSLPTNLKRPEHLNRMCQNSTHNLHLQHFQDAMMSHNLGKPDLLGTEANCRDGQLLPLGHTQHINLGRFLSNVYLDNWNLEKKASSKPKHLRARYTGTPVTKSSLFSLLFGMLPSQHFQKAKVEMFHRSHCVSNSTAPCKCLTAEKVQETHRDMLNARFQKYLQGNVLGEFSDLFSVEKENVNFMQMISYIMLNLCHRINVFCNVQDCSGVMARDFVKLLKHFDKFIKSITETKTWETYSDIYLFPFLNNLINKFHTAKHVFEKLFIHSVDESFILHLLSAIRYPVKEYPRPASRVVFEVYKKSNQVTKPYFLRVLYNGADITNVIPLCHSNLHDGLCRIKYFIDFHRIKHNTILSKGLQYKSCQS